MSNIVSNDIVSCPICGKTGKMITEHMRTKHNLDKKNFKLQYPDCLLVSPSSHARKSENTTNRNKENWSNSEYRRKMTKYLKDSAPTRMRNYILGHNKWWKELDDESRRRICSLGGKALMDKHGQKFLTEGKKSSKLFHDTKSLEMRNYLYEMYVRGANKNSLKEYYSDVTKSTVKLRSTYELSVYNILKTHNIDFIYEPGPFKYVDHKGKIRNYYPDFELTSRNTMIEVKPRYFVCEDTWNKAESVLRQGYKFVLVDEHVFNQDKLLELIECF